LATNKALAKKTLDKEICDNIAKVVPNKILFLHLKHHFVVVYVA
jgi:hypothetical protein